MDKKIKVMQFIHGFNTGGAETLVKDYVLKIDKEIFDIVVLCFEHHEDSPYEKILEENNIRIIYLDDLSFLKKKSGSFFRIIKIIQRLFLVKQYIKKEKPDVLHTHLSLNIYVWFARIKNKCKIFHTIHNEPKIIWDKAFEKALDFKCAKHLVKHKNMKIIVLHEEMKREINKMLGINNSIVLNNGIDFLKFNKDGIKNKKDVLEELNIPKNSFIVGHIGRFRQQKNHSFLVDVFSEMYKENRKAFLLLIGDGEEKEKTEEKLNSLGLKNKYLILANRDDIPDLLNIMHCFVLPSKYEGLPVSLIEAQKMNIPCFISDTISDSAIISNLVTKISLNEDCTKWANKIIEYTKPKKIILNNDEWDINKIVKKLEKIYEEY